MQGSLVLLTSSHLCNQHPKMLTTSVNYTETTVSSISDPSNGGMNSLSTVLTADSMKDDTRRLVMVDHSVTRPDTFARCVSDPRLVWWHLENGRLLDRYRIGTNTGCIVSKRIGFCCIGETQILRASLQIRQLLTGRTTQDDQRTIAPSHSPSVHAIW